MKLRKIMLAATVVAISATAEAQVRITEWQYNGSEFVEFTNTGASSVDFTGWSYSDSARSPGAVSLTAFGDVAAGESVLLSESTAAAFRTLWGLVPSVKVIGGNTANLGRGDEINIYDAASLLIDRLTYGDNVAGVGGPRTDVTSGRTDPINLGTNNVTAWVLSTVGNADFATTSTSGGFVGSPGRYNVVPEPTSIALIAMGTAGLMSRRRKA